MSDDGDDFMQDSDQEEYDHELGQRILADDFTDTTLNMKMVVMRTVETPI
jgi:hypothetical protein